jgi:adenosine deaminase
MEYHFNADIYNRQEGCEDDNPARFSFSINSDDRGMFNTTLTQNLEMCVLNPRVPDYIFRIATNSAIKASFASDEVKKELFQTFMEEERYLRD